VLNIHPTLLTPQTLTLIQDIIARYAQYEWYWFAADCACDEEVTKTILTKW
jgi:hypothetical protein